MKTWLRRTKGAIGMGLTWAVGWMPIGALVAMGLFVVGLDPPGLPGFVWRYATLFGALGFVGGTVFSAVLRVAEGRRRFEELSFPRFAAWGAVGGLILGGLAITAGLWGPGLQTIDAVIAGMSTVLGASSAAATLALARKAESQERIKGDRSLEEIGLTEGEKARLLGAG
jgi:hypothetical protein